MENAHVESTKKRKVESDREECSTSANGSSSLLHSSFFAQKYSPDECGFPTNIYCPACGREISGSYLTIFKCPHCKIQIWRDDKDNVNIPAPSAA